MKKTPFDGKEQGRFKKLSPHPKKAKRKESLYMLIPVCRVFSYLLLCLMLTSQGGFKDFV